MASRTQSNRSQKHKEFSAHMWDLEYLRDHPKEAGRTYYIAYDEHGHAIPLSLSKTAGGARRQGQKYLDATPAYYHSPKPSTMIGVAPIRERAKVDVMTKILDEYGEMPPDWYYSMRVVERARKSKVRRRSSSARTPHRPSNRSMRLRRV